MADLDLDRSYRALFAVPAMGRLLFGMFIARVSGTMVGVAVVLFTLQTYGSPVLAGLATFASIFPGLLVSPIAGALLDRHGRTRLIVLDLLVALASLVLIGLLARANALPPWLLLLIAATSSLTGPLSATGLRSLFPIIVPSHLWERVNALDSNGYVVASILGPPIAAGLVGVLGGSTALIGIGLSFGVAAIVLSRVPDPETETATTGNLLLDAWQGLRYTLTNPTLRGLGLSISVLNLMGGAFAIVVPVLVLDRLGYDEVMVGIVFAIQGIGGMLASLVSGRFDSRGRERQMLVIPMIITGATLSALLVSTALPVLIGVMVVTGLVNGPADIALFTLRQRRTDPAWTGRAFAVSMSFNFLGIPIGSVIGGLLADRSLEAAIALSVVAPLAAGAIAWLSIPQYE
jgi:MFS family permease